MKRHSLEVVVFAVLFVVGVWLRVYLRYLPNVAPVAAIALFAGYFFRSHVVAILLPLAIMFVSDRWIGGYHWLMMASVYAMLALPVACSALLRRSWNRMSTGVGDYVKAGVGLVACTLGSAGAFFLVTNLVTWMQSGLYESSLAGLMTCFARAIPFFRYTLAGDVVFVALLFGGYAMIRQLAARFELSPREAVA